MKTEKSHHSKILELLSDKKFHCGTEITKLFIKDDRKRISELNQAGYLIVGLPCDLHIHSSRIFMRKLVRKPKKINLSQQWKNMKN